MAGEQAVVHFNPTVRALELNVLEEGAAAAGFAVPHEHPGADRGASGRAGETVINVGLHVGGAEEFGRGGAVGVPEDVGAFNSAGGAGVVRLRGGISEDRAAHIQNEAAFPRTVIHVGGEGCHINVVIAFAHGVILDDTAATLGGIIACDENPRIIAAYREADAGGAAQPLLVMRIAARGGIGGE